MKFVLIFIMFFLIVGCSSTTKSYQEPNVPETESAFIQIEDVGLFIESHELVAKFETVTVKGGDVIAETSLFSEVPRKLVLLPEEYVFEIRCADNNGAWGLFSWHEVTYTVGKDESYIASCVYSKSGGFMAFLSSKQNFDEERARFSGK